MLRQVWNKLDGEEKADLISLIATNQCKSPDPQLFEQVSTKANIRPRTLAKASPEQLAKYLRLVLWKLDPVLRGRSLCMAFIGSYPDSVTELYKALGFDVDGPFLSEADTEKSIDGEELAQAVSRLLDEWDSPRPLLMCGAIAEGGLESWRLGAAEATTLLLKSFRLSSLVAELVPKQVGEDIVVARNTAETEEEPPTLAEKVDPLVFTALDRLLIRTIVDSLQEEIGAPRPEEAQDIVQEILDMNSSRIVSRFHEGFLDSLRGREITKGRSGSNEDRECWYLVGYFMAKLRKHDRVQVFGFVQNLPASDRRLLVGRDAPAPSLELLPHLIRAATEVGDIRFVIHALRGRPKADMGLYWALIRWIETDLIPSDSGNALEVLSAVEQWVDSSEGDPGERAIREFFCRKARVTVHRIRGEFSAVEHTARVDAECPLPIPVEHWVAIPGSLALACR
jgi:hypothetical protein